MQPTNSTRRWPSLRLPGCLAYHPAAKTQIDRFRRLTLSVEGHMGEVVSEHRAIATAIASGNPATAIASMQTHLNDVIPVLEFVRKSCARNISLPISAPEHSAPTLASQRRPTLNARGQSAPRK